MYFGQSNKIIHDNISIIDIRGEAEKNTLAIVTDLEPLPSSSAPLSIICNVVFRA